MCDNACTYCIHGGKVRGAEKQKARRRRRRLCRLILFLMSVMSCSWLMSEVQSAELRLWCTRAAPCGVENRH
jgi:hypothetical protein